MAGSTAALGVLAVAAVLAVGGASVAAAGAEAARVAGGADAAALAAADAASGAVPGIPCERAAEVAAANGATLDECVVDGLIATVRVSASFGPLPVTARARAGPAP